MRGQRRQSRGSRGRVDRRGGRKFTQGRRQNNDDRPAGRFRKGSRDLNRGPRRSGQRYQQRSDDRVRRGITRDQNGKRRGSKGSRNDNDKKPRDLDGELMNYWVKSGKKQDDDGKNIAQLKLNEQLDNYWKQKEQNTEKVQQKKKQ